MARSIQHFTSRTPSNLFLILLQYHNKKAQQQRPNINNNSYNSYSHLQVNEVTVFCFTHHLNPCILIQWKRHSVFIRQQHHNGRLQHPESRTSYSACEPTRIDRYCSTTTLWAVCQICDREMLKVLVDCACRFPEVIRVLTMGARDMTHYCE